jgi:hypothetical protein
MKKSSLKPSCGDRRAHFSLLPAALAHFDFLQHADEFLRRVLVLHAGLLQQEDEGGRRAVHDRDFLGRHFDVQVVDAEAGAGRHQVFDGRHARVVLDQDRGHAGVAHDLGARREFDDRVEVDAAEHDAGIDRGRAQRQFDLAARVQPDAGRAHQFFDGSLFEHGPIISRWEIGCRARHSASATLRMLGFGVRGGSGRYRCR